jgi:DnaJ-class molecular chaperone
MEKKRMTEKTFCKRCNGVGIFYTKGWDTWEYDEPYDCPDCEGTGEVEYHSKSELKRIETLKDADKSGREATGMAGCGVPITGHNCTCGDSQ